MKQIAQYQDGRLELQEVPRPSPPPGGVAVQTTHSVISIGTEKMKVEQARMNLLQKARARPDQVRKVLDTARALGWKSALEKVRNRLESPTPMGYSASGIVVEVDPLNTRLKVGDRVACGGAECAFHAEYIAIPDMLACPVPAGVPGWQAAYTTLVSIALQAVRQLEPRLGDRVMVMGQGLVGLLVTNLVQAGGGRVMAVDVAEGRRPLCLAMGAERVVIGGGQSLTEEVRDWTEGYGVDGVVLCTGTASNQPVEQAGAALRDRGRLVIVGITKTDLDWRVFCNKELDVRYSRSYGPGRYDTAYEWGGSDYPIGYVRWTEQRNFGAALDLMARGKLNLSALTTRRVPFADSLAVYQSLLGGGASDVGVVIDYPAAGETPGAAAASVPASTAGKARERLSAPAGRLHAIGAGNFARTMLLPHLKGEMELGMVVNQTALSANHVKTKFGFAEALTDAALATSRARGDAVLIATRHHLHAPLTLRALAGGCHVFVEKPLCLTREELSEIDRAVETKSGSVMVGFNRRFAPAMASLKRAMAGAPGPKSASYRVWAGPLDPQHWYANYEESGGRVLGEACHFLDCFCHVFESEPVRVSARAIGPLSGRRSYPDGVTAQVAFADGSCGQLLYTAEGDPSWPKETLTVFGAGMVGEIENFLKLTLHRGRKVRRETYRSKGHAEEMGAWLSFLKGRTEHPLPYGQARTSMRLTFAVLDSIREGRDVRLDEAGGLRGV